MKKGLSSFKFFSGSITIALMVLTAVPVHSQYFGRNKVQYEDFDFKVAETRDLKIYYYESEAGISDYVTSMAETWYDRYTDLFDHKIGKPQPLIIYANHADFQQTNAISGLIQQGTGGVTEGLKNRVVLPLTGVYQDDNHVIGHELVHAFQFSIMKSHPGGIFKSNNFPLWFIEGMAEYFSIGDEDALTSMWMRDAVLHDDLPDIDQIGRDPKYFPYRYGHAVCAYIGGEWGDRAVVDLYKMSLRSSWGKAFKEVLGVSVDSLSERWKKAVRAKYSRQIEGRVKPSDMTGVVIEGGINISPVLSPDGRYMALLSRKDPFSLDLYLADAQTGRMIDKLASSNTDAHFDALRFMNSSGTWSPEGEKFAFIIYRDGDNGIAVLNVKKRELARIYRSREIRAITGLAWSPDGRYIAVSGTSGGVSDLFLLEVADGSIERLTDDRYAEIQPDWSPDGNTIAFSTDRGEQAGIDELVSGEMKIGLMDVQSREIKLVYMSDRAKHINPRFSPEGDNLYFISDPDGVSNIYRYSFDEKRFYRLTNVATGVTGFTGLSPAMSVANKDGNMVFTVFEKTDYNIYSMQPDQIHGEPFEPEPMLFADNTMLPPADTGRSGIVDMYTESGRRENNYRGKIKKHDYSPSLELVSIGQTGIGVSVDRSGTSVAGGTSMLFSDMLGNRILEVAIYSNGGLKEIGAQAVYQNRRNRINWGIGAGHIPQYTALMYSSLDTVEVEGQPTEVLVRELVRHRVYTEKLMLLSEYPFSINRRIEAGMAYSHISYDSEYERVTLTPYQVLSRETGDFDSPDPLDLVQFNLAYVGDYSYFGFTSPANGRRYRLEVEPTIGSLQFLTLSADYRHYFFLDPFTLAFRFFHAGRYLKDAESDRLAPYYLGNETLVRGYALGTIDPGECSSESASGGCAEFDRLVGSRIAVFNTEFRIPFFGTQEYGIIDFPYLPLEFAAFFDAGVAWTKNAPPEPELKRKSDKRIPVFSTGMAARVNLSGYLVVQFYYAYPFQRPESDGQFGIVFSPGW